MKESVSAVFATSTKVYFVKRQNYLSVFPGYFATPGGKVDSSDSEAELKGSIWPLNVKPKILHALIREVQEELNYDLLEGITSGVVQSIDFLGVAVSPEFNPYRFKNYYFKIYVREEINFNVDSNEAEFGEWNTPSGLLDKYQRGEMLAVPPAILLLKLFTENSELKYPVNMNLPYDAEVEVPMIESLAGVRQLLPLSNTFPPANRTNSFIIGDGGSLAPKLLIDPAPKDEVELRKYLNTIARIGFDSIFITHHHSDHYQYVREIALEFNVAVELSRDTFERISLRRGSEYFQGIDVIFRKEGDVVTKSLGMEVIVYEVPGHDEGQLGLAPVNNSWFLVGDLIQTIGTVVIQAPEGDMKKYFSTLERIIAMNPKHCIPSHGIITGGIYKLEETLKHRRMREMQILNFLKAGKKTSELLECIYPGLQDYLRPYANRTIEAHLKKLHEEKCIT